MRIEDVEHAATLASVIRKHEAKINLLEKEDVLNLRIEVQRRGGRTEIAEIPNGTSEYAEITSILTKTFNGHIESWHKEYVKLDKRQ